MHIYMRHPVHGTKVATMDEEAIYDEEHGWTRYTPGQSAETPSNELIARRRGRRPMTEDTARDDNDSGRSD
jgi:hypothetical protein